MFKVALSQKFVSLADNYFIPDLENEIEIDIQGVIGPNFVQNYNCFAVL